MQMERAISACEATAKPFPTIWTFIAADCASFGVFFLIFMADRLDKVALFNQSAKALNVTLGLANTLILISGSLMVALANRAAQMGDQRKLERLLWASSLVGSLFGVVKIAEYSIKVMHGITPMTNDFFTYYFILTGVHFFHYVIGMGVLIALAVGCRSRRVVDERFANFVEWGGLYWHMVDLLWVFLFSMLYLMGEG